MTTPHPRWLASRRALHAHFVATCKPPDASWLCYLGRPPATLDLDAARDLWRAAARAPGTVRPVNHLYVHVPFCKSICSFCNYERLRPTHPSLLQRWEQRLIHTVESLAPALRDVPFSTMYFGGGTPSVLPAAQLRRVVAALEANLDLRDAASRYFELDPAVLSDDRIQALSDLGFAHLSFGLQTLDADVNDNHNRGKQGRELIGRRFDQLRAAGIEDVSCDFLLGLAGTDVAGILSELDETLGRWYPVRVDVFQLVPTQAYLDSHFGGSRTAFDRHILPFQQQGPDGVRALAAKHGYRLNDGEGHAISLWKHNDAPTVDPRTGQRLPDGPTAYTQQACEQDAPLNLLGLGTSARSQIFGSGWLQYRDPGDDVGADGPAHFEGGQVSLADEALMWLVHDLRDRDSTDRARFVGVFGCDVEGLFPAAVAAWRAEGLLARDEAEVLELVPQGSADRLATLLWLVEETRLEYEIGKRSRMDLSGSGLAGALGMSVGDAVGAWQISRFETGRVHLSGAGSRALRVRPTAAGLKVALEGGAVDADLRRFAARLKGVLGYADGTSEGRT